MAYKECRIRVRLSYKECRRRARLSELLYNKDYEDNLYNFLQDYKNNGFFEHIGLSGNDYKYNCIGEGSFQVITEPSGIVHRIRFNVEFLSKLDYITRDKSVSIYNKIPFLLEYVKEEFGVEEKKPLNKKLLNYNIV